MQQCMSIKFPFHMCRIFKTKIVHFVTNFLSEFAHLFHRSKKL